MYYIITKDLTLKKIIPYKLIFTIILLLGLNSFLIVKLKESPTEIIKDNIIIIDKTKKKDSIPKLNKENVLIELKKNNVYFPEIVLKQALLETGGFKSNICIENNNLFGIRHYPANDTTYAICKNRGFLAFKDWRDSVKEYKRLQKRMFTDKYYYEFLNKANYAEKDLYIQRLKELK
jgi:uncharacterized FlgJ-related protein